MNIAINASNLSKHFGDIVAVDNINFSVHRGECFGLLGPNGAGKSSTIRMITCSSPLTSGQLIVNGLNVNDEQRSVKSHIGIVPQNDNLDPDLPVKQNLEVYARYYGLDKQLIRKRVEEQLEIFELSDRADSPIHSLSGGMRRRLLIARALLHNPSILILDEPTVGLDPQARHIVWQQLRQLTKNDVTQVLTTHYMDEAEQLCDRIIVINHGKILAEAKPQELIQQYVGNNVLEIQNFSNDIELLKRSLDFTIEYEIFGDKTNIYASDDNLSAISAKIKISNKSNLRKANLEDVFLRLTGRRLLE